MEHLHNLSLSSILTGMTCRNLAIVWAPNLLRSLHWKMASEESLKDIGVQAKVIEYFISNYNELFSEKCRSINQVDVSGLKYSSMLGSHNKLYSSFECKFGKEYHKKERQLQQDSVLPQTGNKMFNKVICLLLHPTMHIK